MTEEQEEARAGLLRNIAIGERLACVVDTRLSESLTGPEVWSVVREVGKTLGVLAICLILDKKMYEYWEAGSVTDVVGVKVPKGRILVGMRGDTRKASLAFLWMVRRALEKA